jgi:hypothetical protein
MNQSQSSRFKGQEIDSRASHEIGKMALFGGSLIESAFDKNSKCAARTGPAITARALLSKMRQK